GLGVHPAVGHVVGPGGEQVVQLVDGLDAAVLGFGQERLPDIAVQPLLFPPAFWRVGPAVNQAYAQDRARAGKPRIGERRAVVAVVPTSAQLRLCRRRDYADPGAEGLLSGGGRAE